MMWRVRDGRLEREAGAVRFVRSPNIGGRMKPRFLVIHYTASGPGSDMAGYFSSTAAKVSAHLVIRRDGTVKQCVPFDTVAWHAGRSEWTGRDGRKHVGLNACSIGIEIENWGPLKKTAAGWMSWTGAPVDAAAVMQARHRYGTPEGGWEVFTQAQIDAATGVARAICAAYGIAEILGHDDIAPGRKSDPGPAWPMARFVEAVTGGRPD